MASSRSAVVADTRAGAVRSANAAPTANPSAPAKAAAAPHKAAPSKGTPAKVPG